jgi:putative hydrolase of the HAD superfamily
MRTLLWDFDGTLAYRKGMWSGTLVEVVRSEAPELAITRDDVSPYLQTGFPWQTPEAPHPEIESADDWWEQLNPVFAAAFAGLGIAPARAEALAKRVRRTFCNPERWRLYGDVLPTLTSLAEHGWSHRILTNHVPELSGLVGALGLSELIQEIHNSADSGYEKPHPEAFRRALRGLPPRSAVWMIGDNIRADVLGAQQAGIPAILVRSQSPEALRYCEDLRGVASMLAGIQPDAAADTD